MYDVIVIGGGLGGLSAALKLVQKGKKVALFEKHFMPGGYATNFKRKDKDGNLYTFDVALHGMGGLIPGNPFYNILESIEIINKVEFLRKEEAGTIFDGKELIDIPDTFEGYYDHLVRRYPEYESGIKKIFDEAYELKRQLISGNPPVLFQKLQGITLYDYIKSYVNDEKFIEEFCFLWLYYGLPPKKLNALFYMLAWVSYHIGGTFYVKGGAGKLSDTFADLIKANGGDIFLSSEVINIDVEGSKVKAIYTKSGRIEAEKFIFACDPNEVIKLMDSNNTTVNKYKENLDKKKVGISLTQLYIGLDCKSTEVGITKADYFIKKADHETCYSNILKGNYKESSFGITSYDMMDKDLNKAVGVIVIVVGDHINTWPEYKSKHYKDKKAEVTEQLLELIDEYFPKVRDHIKVLELGTPHTMKRYTNNSEGAVYGWEQNITQGGYNRLSSKTDFSNVYLAGAWTNPGGGFEGAITGGVFTAERILKEESKMSVKSNDLLEKPDMSLKSFLIGMTANINKKKVSKDINIIYEFNFDNKDKYYIEIKNRKAKLLTDNKGRESDVIINTSFEVWYNIAFGNIEGRDALFDGFLTVEGSGELFMKIPEFFNTDTLGQKSEEKKKLNPLLWLTITLVPWIVTSIITNKFHIKGDIISLLAILYTILIITFIKPKQFKVITKLESLTLITFSLYGLVYIFDGAIFYNMSNWILDVILIISFLISSLIRKPLTEDYSKEAYSEKMIRTKLFKDINIHLTVLWFIVFTCQFIIKIFVPDPWNYFGEILAVIGLLISYFYPKIILGGE